MSKQAVILVDILRDVVAATQAAYRVQKGDNNLTVTYMHGPIEEIEANLIEIAGAKGLPGYTGPSKYPLIAVVQDFPEDRPGPGGYYSQTTLPIVIIATLTDNKYKAEKRYTETFVPTLYPLYELFLQSLARDGRLAQNDPTEIPHRKFDRLYYGRAKFGTQLADYVDAIEIQNLRLTVRQFC
jgi:hypothetical protein